MLSPENRKLRTREKKTNRKARRQQKPFKKGKQHGEYISSR